MKGYKKKLVVNEKRYVNGTIRFTGHIRSFWYPKVLYKIPRGRGDSAVSPERFRFADDHRGAWTLCPAWEFETMEECRSKLRETWLIYWKDIRRANGWQTKSIKKVWP